MPRLWEASLAVLPLQPLHEQELEESIKLYVGVHKAIGQMQWSCDSCCDRAVSLRCATLSAQDVRDSNLQGLTVKTQNGGRRVNDPMCDLGQICSGLIRYKYRIALLPASRRSSCS